MLIGAGCSASPTPVQTGTSVNTGINPNAPSPSTITVTIQGFAFSPSDFTVAKGTPIIVTNNDSAPHTLTADDGSFDTGTIQPGASVNLATANIPSGTHAFHCAVHPNMKGSLIVQ